MSNIYRGPFIDASYQVWVHLVKWFQRRRFLEGTGYEYDGNVFVAWVLQVRRAEVVTK